MQRMEFGRAGVLASAVMLLASCSNHPAKPPVTATSVTPRIASATSPQAPNMAPVAAGTALPPGYKIDSGRTLVFGTDENWTGRLSYSTSTSADEVFDFLHREMPNFGWVETTAMRSDVSLLTFASVASNRVATIHIERGSALSGNNARVDMVVSPASSAPNRVPPRPQSASQPR